MKFIVSRFFLNHDISILFSVQKDFQRFIKDKGSVYKVYQPEEKICAGNYIKDLYDMKLPHILDALQPLKPPDVSLRNP